MKKLLPFLILAFTLQSCENRSEKQNATAIKNTELKNITEINVIGDPVQNVALLEKNNDLLFDIEGNYTFKDDVTDCKIILSLFYRNGVLNYQMKTNTRALSGDATIDLNKKKTAIISRLKI